MPQDRFATAIGTSERWFVDVLNIEQRVGRGPPEASEREPVESTHFYFSDQINANQAERQIDVFFKEDAIAITIASNG